MDELASYVMNSAIRGECRCTQCIDTKTEAPLNHTIDMIFFSMTAHPDADATALKRLVQNHQGRYGQVDLFDGKEHSYLELGGWIGDQGTALMLMGLGAQLGLWELHTPRNMLGDLVSDDTVMAMAGAGYITIQAPT